MKHLSGLLMAALLLVAMSACGDDPEPSRGGSRTITPTLLTHVTGTDGQVVVTSQQQKMILDLDHLTAQFNINARLTDGSTPSFTLSNVQLTYNADDNRYTFGQATTSDARVTQLSGVIDFNEGAVWINYVVDGKQRVHITPTSIFYTSTTSVITHDALNATYHNAIYQFEIDPATMLAKAWVMQLLDANKSRYFNTITTDIDYIKTLSLAKDKDLDEFVAQLRRNNENKFKVEATAEGYVISGSNLQAGVEYRSHTGSTDASATTLNFKFASLNFNLDLAGGSASGTFTLNDDTTVKMDGTTYLQAKN